MSVDDAPLEVVPLDDAPLDAPLLDPFEEEPAPVELDAPLPDPVPPQAELQLCAVHWTTPLQSKLVHVGAAMHTPRADEHLLLMQVLHVVVRVMTPVATEIKSSGLPHPPARPLDPPPPELTPPASLFWFSPIAAGSPFPDPLPSLLFDAHASGALTEPAITTVHAAALNISAS